jgi:hypothetical protein
VGVAAETFGQEILLLDEMGVLEVVVALAALIT